MAESDDIDPKMALGGILREMVDSRGLRQKALASKISLTESSLSNILNGKARPRQLTLSRLIQQLEPTPDEQQRLLAAYDHAEMVELPERPASPEQPIPLDEIERVTRYMEMKSMSVTFQDDVEKALNGAAVYFERSHRQENIICDFLLPGPPRVAIDCKYNLNRDWDRTVASVKLLKVHLDLEVVLIVVPYQNETTFAEEDRINTHGGRIVAVADLNTTVRSILLENGGKQ
jgi:transcriptional regulator with XRE-family HTH domain